LSYDVSASHLKALLLAEWGFLMIVETSMQSGRRVKSIVSDFRGGQSRAQVECAGVTHLF
jgi:hypothetical protein